MNHLEKIEIYSPVRFASGVIRILWYLGLLGAVLFVLIAAAALTGIPDVAFEVPLNATAEIRSLSQATTLSITGYETPVIRGSFGDFPIATRLLICLILVVGVAAFLGTVYHLRKLIESVSQKRPIDSINPRRLRIIAYIVMVVGPLMGILQYLLSLNLLDKIGSGAAILRPNLDLHLITVILGLLILVIAAVFQAGLLLRKEADLTI